MGEKRLDSYDRDCYFDGIESMGVYTLLFQIFLLSNDHYASISDERYDMDGPDGITIFITMLMEGEFSCTKLII